MSEPGLLPDWFDQAASVAVAHVMIPVEAVVRIIVDMINICQQFLNCTLATTSARSMPRSEWVARAMRDRLLVDRI
jgi:hypothetical protein